MPITKQTYHPLVRMFYHLELLPDHQLKQIPYTTKRDWNNTNHNELFGFDWVEPYYHNHLSLLEIQQKEFFKNAFEVLVTLNDFHGKVTQSLRGYKRALKKHKKVLVETVDVLTKYLSVNNACDK
jgi:hypothetical protein